MATGVLDVAPTPSSAEERLSLASNWTLVWWRFRKHRLALLSLAVLVALYTVVLCPDFFSTQDPEATDARVAFVPVQRLHLFDGASLRPWVPAIVGKGSGDAPTALTEGTAAFGPMSRTMKADELDRFEKKFGYKPVGVPTSIDMLGVYVHKDNPIKELTLQQVDAIFSKSRKGGFDKDIRTWGDLGLTGDWANKPISLYGRNSESGTYGYFKEHALFKGDYKDSVKEQPGSSAVVQGVASDKFGIGYSGIGYKTADVRAVPLASKPGGKAVEAH